MTVTVPKNTRGPIVELTLPAMLLAVDVVLRNKTTGDQLTINIPAEWKGEDLTLDFFGRTIKDQTGADRSALLDPTDNSLWIPNPLITGTNDLEIELVRAATTKIGPGLPGAAESDASFGTLVWTNPNNIKVEDGSSAFANKVTNGTANTQYLKATKFGLILPAEAIVKGITVVARRKKSGTGATVVDSRVRLVKAGVVQATDKSAGAAWPGAGLEPATFGGAADLWGGAWTAEDIMNSGFGVVFSPSVTAIEGFGANAEVDVVKMEVNYVDAQTVATLRCERGYY